MDTNKQDIVKDNGVTYIECYKDTSNILKYNSIFRELVSACSNTPCPIKDNTWARCVPNGKLNADIMFVDSYPNNFDVYGGCFTGKTGEILHQGLNKLNREDIYCTVLIKCNNIQDTNQNVIRTCLQHHFIKELELVNPSKILLTESAYHACVKYSIIHEVPNIYFFQKNVISIVGSDKSIELYITPDFNLENEQSVKSLIQGLQFLL